MNITIVSAFNEPIEVERTESTADGIRILLKRKQQSELPVHIWQRLDRIVRLTEDANKIAKEIAEILRVNEKKKTFETVMTNDKVRETLSGDASAEATNQAEQPDWNSPGFLRR